MYICMYIVYVWVGGEDDGEVSCVVRRGKILMWFVGVDSFCWSLEECHMSLGFHSRLCLKF